jgi:hypothetical protein
MAEIDVTRHVIREHQPAKGEDYDPTQDMLIVVHKNPNNPDDPVEFGHHIRMSVIAYRKEMWGLPDYASTIDMELKDLERYYARESDDEDYGVHPLAGITEHYFEVPPVRMKSFNPDYVFDRVESKATALPATTDGAVAMCLETVLSGVEDVKACLASADQKNFACRGMTGLSTDTVNQRRETNRRTEEQTRRITLVPSAPLDAVRQLLTDREPDLERAREGFVNHALMEGDVPEIMRKRVVAAAVRRGLLKENTWM